MSAHRFFLTESLGAPRGEVLLPLSADDVRHAVGALRVRAGERLEVVEPGVQGAWLVEVVSIDREAVTARILQRLERVHHPRVTLIQGMAKGEKMDAIVRQAVELGAERIVPVQTRRSVVRLDAGKRAARGQRWRRVAKSAAEQSRRDVVPDVADPVDLDAVLDSLVDFDEVVVLWEEATRDQGLAAAASSWVRGEDTRVAIVVGPEGGLDPAEVEQLVARGAVVVGLGPSVLRTETAAIVGLALAMHHLGGLGGSAQ